MIPRWDANICSLQFPRSRDFGNYDVTAPHFTVFRTERVELTLGGHIAEFHR